MLLDVFEPLDELLVDSHLAAGGVHGDVDGLGLRDSTTYETCCHKNYRLAYLLRTSEGF